MADILYSGALYDNSHATQFAQGERLIDFVDFSQHSDMLDAGCGNGRTTSECWLRNPKMRVTATDISDSQIDSALAYYARMREEFDEKHTDDGESYGGIDFEVRSFDQIDERERYDLVFSNAALHWLRDPRDGYEHLFRALKPGGLLAVHQGGYGTYRGLHAIARQAIDEVGLSDRYEGWEFPSFYPTVDGLRALLEGIGFEDVEVSNVEVSGKDASPTLAKDFTVASLIYYKIPSVSDEEFERIRQAYNRICESTEPDLYSNRLYATATKPL